MLSPSRSHSSGLGSSVHSSARRIPLQKQGMQKILIVSVVFLSVARPTLGKKHCDLDVPESKQSKFIKMVKGWFGSLKNNVKESKTADCQDCDSIRPPGQKEVGSEKDTKTGCHCKITEKNNKFECACCFKLKKWDYLICNAAGFTLGNKEVFLVVTMEDQAIIEVHVSLEAWWAQLLSKLLSCIPLPPPVAFLSICFKPSLEKPSPENNNAWVLCIQLKIGILLVPVISIRPKCFHLGGNSRALLPSWMNIDGQTDPKTDLENPADSDVIDENYNSLVCLANFKKSEAGKCKKKPEEKGCTPPTKEVSNKINWRQSIPGETPFLAVLHQEKFPKPVEDVHGDDDKYPYIGQVLNRAGEEKWMNQSEIITLNQPGRVCGGALLTKNKLLTICACVRSFYYLYKLKKDPGEDVIDSPFDIQSADIFLEFSGVTYLSGEAYHLEKDETKFMTDSTCTKHMAKGDKWILETSMIVMTFAPEIKNAEPRQFAQWPPRKIEKNLDVDLVGFGMEPVDQQWLFKGTSGEVIDFDKQSVDVFMKQCELTEYGKTELQKEPHVSLGGRVSGFCSSSRDFQLCYGKIGLPLTTGRKHRQLVGLSSLPIDCSNEGSTAGAIFDGAAIRDIDKYIARAHSTFSEPVIHILLVFIMRV